MKRTIFLFLFTISINILNAQSSSPQIISTAGETYNGSSTRVDWTLGELVITTINTSDHKITQGFHQPNYIITSVSELPQEVGEIKVYPNPTSDRIEMELVFEKTRNIIVQLIDINGRVIWMKENQGRNIKQLENIKNLPNGTYFLNFIIDEKRYPQSFRIQKIN